MESPEWKRISSVKAGVLKVNQVKSAFFKRTAVRLDLSEDESFKRAAIFLRDFDDHLILRAALLDRCNSCRNRTHDAGLSAGALTFMGFPTPNYFFAPRTVSFATLATRNLSTVLAGILIFCCVLGLKPVRAFLFCFTSLPKPGRTNSPVFFVVL